MYTTPMLVWKSLFVIFIGLGGTFVSFKSGLISFHRAKYDLTKCMETDCPLHQQQMIKKKVGISYLLRPSLSDRVYEDEPMNENLFPYADFNYYVGPSPKPNPLDSALVYVCQACIDDKIAYKKEIKKATKALYSSPQVKTAILQKCLNLRPFQKYFRYPRKRLRMPLVLVHNEIVNRDMRLIKYHRRARILDFDEIYTKGRTTYLEFTRFDIHNDDHLALSVSVSYRYPVEDVGVDMRLKWKKGRWVIDEYDIDKR